MCNVPPKFYQLCRLCLSHNASAMVPLQDKDSAGLTVTAKIMTCLSITVSDSFISLPPPQKTIACRLQLSRGANLKSRRSLIFGEHLFLRSYFRLSSVAPFVIVIIFLSARASVRPPSLCLSSAVFSGPERLWEHGTVNTWSVHLDGCLPLRLLLCTSSPAVVVLSSKTSNRVTTCIPILSSVA